MPKIYIDQGHNPEPPNTGAERDGLREQDITYRVGQELATLLRRSGNWDVRLSRPTPETLLGTSNASSLRARTDEANSWGADYFISIHANASNIVSASGAEAFVYSEASPAYALSEDILLRLSEATGLADRGVFARPTLYVLRRTAMPALLLEVGFITNPGDAALMANNPALIAMGIYNGILTYFGE
jgi:N-acetylmuramoyl-L-alanine amidase